MDIWHALIHDRPNSGPSKADVTLWRLSLGNFDFLQSRWPEMHQQTIKAETSVHVEPDVTAIRLRCFGEMAVSLLLQEQNLELSLGGSQFEKLSYLEENEIVEKGILTKFHALRMLGNKAAHGGSVSQREAEDLLRDACSLAQWFYLLMSPIEALNFPPFTLPNTPTEIDRPTAESLSVQLAETEHQLEALRQETDANRPTVRQQEETEDLRRASIQAFTDIDPELRELNTDFCLEDAFAGEALTAGQEELILELQRFLDDKSANVFLLKGYAGTGKTFIAKGLTEYLRSQGRIFNLSAPTGRAAKVIAAKTGCRAVTLHRQIYNFEKLVEYTDDGLEGSETFKNYAQIKINDQPANAVYIVDEASLLSDVYQEGEFFRSGSGYLLKDFFEYVGLDHNDHDKKVIFIGDTAQLPPIGMKFPPALDADYLRKTYGVETSGFELKDVVRQKAGSGVMHNVEPLRDSINNGIFNHLTIDFDSAEMTKVSVEDILPTYLESCGHAVNGKSVIITKSNAETAEFNRAIRQKFFPGKVEVTAGDKLMVVANTQIDGLFISNGDFVWVREASEQTETRNVTLKRKHPETQVVESTSIALTFREVCVGIRDTEGQPYFFTTKILENLLYNNNPGLSSDEQKALYLDFCIRHKNLNRGDKMFRKALGEDPYFNALRAKFGYAITCHKAQGSEWEHVFVSCSTSQNPLSADYFRWLYTAMTRTTDRLYLLNPPHKLLGDRIRLIGDGIWNQNKLTDTPNPRPEIDSVNVPRATDPNVNMAIPTFGMTEQDGLPYAILMQVGSALAGSGVEIEDIGHNQYQEAYYFRRDGASVRVNISYNSRGKVGSIVAVQTDPLSADILQLISHLTGRTLSSPRGDFDDTEVHFNKPFLNDFHARLRTLMGDRDIHIADVVEQQWCQRYTLERSDEVATLDIWYNGNSVFTKCQPVANRSTSGEFLNEVLDVVTVGMGA